jgi:catechol 2,3-dioxygenase
VRPNLIEAVSHVAFRVSDLEACVECATSLVGLCETERREDRVFLTHGGPHHSLEYIAGAENQLDHMGFQVTGTDALSEVRRRVAEAGYEILEREVEGPVDAGFSFVGPESFVIEIHTPMRAAHPVPAATTTAPNRLGHFNINPREVEPMRRLFAEVLGFRVSDEVGDREGWFMRCNSDHHAIAILAGSGTFHHQAWEVQSAIDLGHVGDLLDERGERLLWGPVRHGVGRNIAAYFRDPAGAVIELYTDMDRIESDDAEPGRWDPSDNRWYSLWTDFRPAGFREYGVAPAPLEAP